MTNATATHTPGPWMVWQLAPDSDAQQRAIITTADGDEEVCGVIDNDANARLIAAAPELLAALEYAIIILGRDGIRPLLGEAFTQTDLDQLESAIAKATGR